MQLSGGRMKLIIDISDTIYEGCKRRCAERKSTIAEFLIAKGVPYEESNWIPVSERVPNEMEDVLVWFEYADIGNILQTYGFGHVYDRDRWSPFINGRGDWKNVRIIAWMPLPEPYKETENE